MGKVTVASTAFRCMLVMIDDDDDDDDDGDDANVTLACTSCTRQ